MNIHVPQISTVLAKSLLLARPIAEDDIFETRNGGRARVVHVNSGLGEDHPVVALVTSPGFATKRCLTFQCDGMLLDGSESPFDLVAFLGKRETGAAWA